MTAARRLSRRDFVRLAAGAVAAGWAATAGLPARAGAQPEPAPRWDEVFAAALDGTAMGYAYAVARDGETVAERGVGSARAPQEARNPSWPWTPDTLCNLASVSKPITATAIMTVVQRRGTALLDAPFWDFFVASGRFGGEAGAGVDTVTVRQLLTMHSGLEKNGTLYVRNRSVDDFLTAYLRRPVAAVPGTRYAYSNTNFTILQVLYEILMGGAPGSFARLVQEHVFAPMGIEEGEITAVPAPVTEALCYRGAHDTRPGYAWPAMQCIGPGGWLATARGLLKFLVGVRGHAVLDEVTTRLMLRGKLGWYEGRTRFGPYYHHNGGLFTGAGQQLHTGAVHFPAGYDAVLLINSPPGGTIRLMARAFVA